MNTSNSTTIYSKGDLAVLVNRSLSWINYAVDAGNIPAGDIVSGARRYYSKELAEKVLAQCSAKDALRNERRAFAEKMAAAKQAKQAKPASTLTPDLSPEMRLLVQQIVAETIRSMKVGDE